MLGEFLTSKNWIKEEALDDALGLQRFVHQRLGRLLRDLGYIDQKQLNLALQGFLNVEVLELTTDESIQKRILEIPHTFQSWATEQECIVSEVNPDKITFFAKAFNDQTLEKAEREFGRSASLQLISEEGLEFLFRKVLKVEGPKNNRIQLEAQLSTEQKLKGASPYTALFRDIILNGKNQRASDIHIQPTRDGVDIRFRIDGDMVLYFQLGLEHRESFINEAKRLAQLSIATRGKAQDGRVSFPAWKLDVRTSLLPSQFGEKIVLRLLDLSRSFDLDALGLSSQSLNDLRESLRYKNGVIIISGPTGSGKTTTLYTLLCDLDRRLKNIITLEDPIEYGIEGLTQIQITPKLSFGQALRSVLRQDPDVILVGEIRDQETADLCLKAASTGHLVLSTLHANGAAEVVSRLLNLGIDRYMLNSCLKFSAAQRLVKKLCPHCAIPAPQEVIEQLSLKLKETNLRLHYPESLKVRNSKGCPQCQLGIQGRLPVLEYMRHPEISTYLNQSEGQPKILALSLREAALQLAERGEVDVIDVIEIE